jgi:hypothetical protein
LVRHYRVKTEIRHSTLYTALLLLSYHFWPMAVAPFDISTRLKSQLNLCAIVTRTRNRNIMNPLFVRFGLPWLIFGSAIFALYWTIWHGDGAQTTTPPVDLIKHSAETQPVRNSIDVLNSKTDRAPSHTSSLPNATEPAPTSGASAAKREQPMPAPPTSAVESVAKAAATRASQSSETNIQQALQDVDPRIRYHALAESDAQGIAVPAPTLQQMATSDRDPTVRVMAMIKFSQDPSIHPAMVRAVAEAGLRDGNAAVSAHAREMLALLDQAARSNDEVLQLLPEDTVE